MSANVQRGRRLPSLSAWLGGGGERDPLDPQTVARRRMWGEIDRLLTEHDLEATPANFTVAHAYVSGDPAVRAAIDGANGAVTPATMDEIASTRDADGLAPQVLAQMADTLEERLAEALCIVGQQVASARDYGNALGDEAERVATDPVGALARLIALTSDVVAATREMEEQLDSTRREAEKLRSDLTSARRAADRDHLTGLPNRRFFDIRLTESEASAGCVALCDIDDFKRINDAHGHETGDRVLRFVAKALKDELQGEALVARYGGEEFAFLFDDPDLSAARDALDRSRERLKARSLVDRKSGTPLGRLTFSAGLAASHGHARAALRAADAALYLAKGKGKDRVEVAAADGGGNSGADSD